MEEEKREERVSLDVPPHRWFIGLTSDGSYRFITPQSFESAESYIGQHGGGVFTHAGYLIFASNKAWWSWIEGHSRQYLSAEERKSYTQEQISQMPHINVPEIECIFSEEASKWLEENEDLLKEQGGKYYENIPRNRV